MVKDLIIFFIVMVKNIISIMIMINSILLIMMVMRLGVGLQTCG